MTYNELKEKFYDDQFGLLPEATKINLGKILDAWFGSLDFTKVERITGVDIWSFREEGDIEDDSTELSRFDQLETATEVWYKNSLEKKFDWFILESDDAEDLRLMAEFVKIEL